MKRGNCYVTCEALYHLLGGKKAGWKPMTVRHERSVHWFLAKTEVNAANNRYFKEVLDPTKSQFKTPVPYDKARGRGFLTKQPSKRAREMMRRMVWQT